MNIRSGYLIGCLSIDPAPPSLGLTRPNALPGSDEGSAHGRAEARGCGRGSDLEAAVATVEELGGTVMHAGADTPFGRLATVADPQGAGFQILEIPAEYR